MALNPATAPAAVIVAPPAATSLAENTPPPNEVTLRFRRWTAHGPTAFQRGQEAGFQPHEAERLVARGHAFVVHDRAVVRLDGPPMVRK